MTTLEHLKKIDEYEKFGRYNDDINPVNWDECYPVDENFRYVEKNPFRMFWTKIKNDFIISPFTKKQNKKVFKTIVLGQENLKGIGASIVTSNHYNIFDCLAIRYALKDGNLKYCVAEYNNRKGFLGNMMRAGGILPLSSKFSVQKKFNGAIEYYLRKGKKIVFYPEQAMWQMYEKPRPFRDGAFYYAVKHNVPILPLFTTFNRTGELDSDGVEKKSIVLHIMPPIYPKPELSQKENIEYLKNKNYEMCKSKYEEYYGRKLEYLK